MASRYLHIGSFKYGLDARRSELSSQPGTLSQCQNGFINIGGEIEQRMSFVKDAIPFPPNTFGLQDTDAGLITFGSTVAPDSYYILHIQVTANVCTITTLLNHDYTNGQTIIIAAVTSTGGINGTYVISNVTANTFTFALVIGNVGPTNEATGYAYAQLPTGVSYQQLPTPYFGVLSFASLSSVIYSCNFQGKAFVIAKFTDNTVILYYNALIITQSTVGKILTVGGGPESIGNLSTDFVASIILYSGWAGTANTDASTQTDQTGVARTGCTLVRSPFGVHFTPVSTVVSAAGTINAALVDNNYPGVAGITAIASFTLGGANTGSCTVTAPTTSAGIDTAAAISGGAVAATGANLAATAIAVANAINANGVTWGYTARASGNSVIVYAPLAWGASPNSWTGPNTLSVTTAGGMTDGAAAGGTAITLQLSAPGFAAGSTSFLKKSVGTSGQRQVALTVSAAYAGTTGAAPVLTWAIVNAGGITMSNTTGATNGFSAVLAIDQDFNGTFTCKIADGGAGSSGATLTLEFSVELAYISNR